MTAQKVQGIYTIVGNIRLGALRSHGKHVEAVDNSNKSLGVYPDKASAIETLYRAAGDTLDNSIKGFAAISQQGGRRAVRRTCEQRNLVKRGHIEMRELVKTDDIELLHDEVDDLRGDGVGPLMKFDFKKEKFFIGQDEMPMGREYIAHCDQYARGWIKFINKELIEQRVLKVRDGKPPEREDLGDLEVSGAENDCWVFQRYLPLEDVETGEIVIFVTKSKGGKVALADLLKVYAETWDRGLPTVKLATTKMPSKKYGLTPRPAFPIVRRDGKTTKTVEESGPPERDPNDPGYEILDLDLSR